MSPNPRRNHRSSASQETTTAMAPSKTTAASRPREAPDAVAMDEKLRAQVVDCSLPLTRRDKAQHHKKKHHRHHHHHHHKSRDANSHDANDYNMMKAPKKPSVNKNQESYKTMQDDIEMQISESADSSSSPMRRNHRHSAAGLRETAHLTRLGSHQHHLKSQASGKAARPVPPTSTSKPHPSMSRGGRFQEEGLDSKAPPAPHFLRDDLNKMGAVAVEDNFNNAAIYNDYDSADDKTFQRSLRMASGAPAYRPRRGAAVAHDEHQNFDDIENAIGSIEPPITTTQDPLCPGAFREGGGPQDDEETLFSAPEQNPVPPSQSSTLDNVIAEAELVGAEPRLVVAKVAQERWWNKRRNVRILMAAIVLLLVLLGVLGAVVGISGGGGSSERDNVVDEDNDICSNAISLSSPSSLEGSTINATLDDVGVGTPCAPDAPGIWYMVVGTGNHIIASTCNNVTSYDTAISVFRGGCSDLQCVAYNDDGPASLCDFSSGKQSRAVWTSFRGDTYSVLVHGVDREVGDFRLDIDQVKVENDVCEDAIPLQVPSSIEGSTIHGALDDVGADTTCEPEVPGIWYTVVGTGNSIMASTCNEDTSYLTAISVFRGGCSGLQCVAYSEYNEEASLCAFSSGISSLGNRAVWTSMRGETYSVLVHGYEREVGDFRLDIDQVGVENDFCEVATPLSVPSSIEGSTTNASIEAGLPCGESTPGVWYSVVGTGHTVTASLCNEDTTFSTNLAVFRGRCSSLECIEDADVDLCVMGNLVQRHVSWTATSGEMYHVLVHGFSDIGDFRLDLSGVVDPPENDVCEGAIPLTIPSSIEGSTMFSTLDDVGLNKPCEPEVPGIWYTVVGTGNNIMASTCNNVTSYSTKLSVFGGGCSGLQCVAFNNRGPISLCSSSSGWQSRAVWTSVRGETYSVLVHGAWNGEVGDFRLDLSQGDPVENDVCKDAIPLQIPSSIEGSTMDAGYDYVGTGTPCEQPEASGIWYTVAGTGNNIIASTCNDVTSYTTAISVFRGGCDGLQCVAHNIHGGLESCVSTSGRKSRAVWISIEGETYSVLVHGWRDVGNFRLDVSQVDPIENDVCEDAIPLSIPSSIKGSTTNATSDMGLPCGRRTPGVWYLIVGSGNSITASLCNEDTTFDTYLAVFRGSCSSLECVVENDNGGDSCGSKSRVSWTALDGVNYYVLVQGWYDYNVGNFRLDVVED